LLQSKWVYVHVSSAAFKKVNLIRTANESGFLMRMFGPKRDKII